MNMGLSSLTLGELLSLQRKSVITSAVLEQTLTHTTMITKPAKPMTIKVKGVNYKDTVLTMS